MQETSPASYPAHISEKKTIWYLSIIFLSLILGLTILCHVMIYKTSKSVDTLQADIKNMEVSITSISADRNIVIAKIVRENTLRPSLDLKNIVTQFRLAASKAGVQFDGFNIREDTISTMLIATEGTLQHPDPVGLIINMINTYASGKEQFTLGSIKNISGDANRRTTAIELRINTLPIQ